MPAPSYFIPYEMAATSLRDGDLLAIQAHSFWSRAINLRTFSKTTHVGVALWIDEFSQWAILEAKEKRGVRVYPLKRYIKDNPGVRILWYELLTNDYHIDRAKYMAWSKKQWGKRYASPFQFLRSWGVLTKSLCDYFNIPQDVNGNRFFCSEFISEGLQVGGYPTLLPPAQTSPGDLLELPCYHLKGALVP